MKELMGSISMVFHKIKSREKMERKLMTTSVTILGNQHIVIDKVNTINCIISETLES